PEALLPLLDKEMPGFGELFRAISFEEIGTSALQSRAFAGLANGTFLFALPGSTSACRTAWEQIIRAQLDARTRPCNLATLRPRLKERAGRRAPGLADGSGAAAAGRGHGRARHACSPNRTPAADLRPAAGRSAHLEGNVLRHRRHVRLAHDLVHARLWRPF